MPKHLFLLTIGPVQSFIAQARKTHDLFAGSRLLSKLCATGIRAAIGTWGTGCTIITPETKPTIPASIPNRFLALVESDARAENLKEAAEAVELAIRKKFHKLAEDAIKGLPEPDGYFDQIDHHLDIQWLFQPIDEEGYGHAYKEINKYLAAIKNTRPFCLREETGRKCIVDGELNVKVYRHLSEKEEKNGLPKKLYQAGNEVALVDYQLKKNSPLAPAHIQPGEGMSAVSFTKRRYSPQKITSFDSTAAIALLDLLHGEHGEGKRNMVGLPEFAAYQNFYDHEDEGRYDEQLLFEENLTDKYFETHDLFSSSADLWAKVEEAKHHMSQLRKAVATELEQPFTKYYAIIQFDGDNMGQWLSGELLKPGDDGTVNLQQFHQDFTKAVSAFAKLVDEQLTKPQGRTIFAGGEDFLGLINLHHLFPTMQWLHEQYMEMVDGELRKKTEHYRLPEGRLTLSAGVVIAHYKEPLSEVVKAVAAAEKTAKNQGRNRFFIRAMRHSGGDTSYASSWEALGDLQSLKEELERHFSHNFIAQAVNTLRTMQYLPPDGLLESELNRTVDRSFKESEAGRKEAVKNMLDLLERLYEPQLPESGATDEEKAKCYENISNLFALADFITRKTR